MRSQPWTVATVRTHVAGIHEALVPLWRGVRDLPPLAFLFIEDGRCVAIPDVYEVPREILPQVLRKLSETHGAQYVAFAADAYSTRDMEQAEVEAWYAKGKALSEHPQARRSLVLSVDGPGMSDVTVTVLDDEGREVTETVSHAVSGRLTNLSGRLGEN